MTYARFDFGAALLGNGKVLAAGGMNFAGTSCELYNPLTGTWSSTGSMRSFRAGFGMVKLLNGKVLAVSGVYNGPSTSAEIYNPATGTWSYAASMSTARMGFGIVVLPSGKVLVAGGELAGGYATTLAEIYNPATDSWSPTGPMHDARSGFGMVLLGNGKVLAAGGAITGMALSTAEIYDPSAGSWTQTGSMHNAVYSAGFAVLSSSSGETKVLRAGGMTSGKNVLSTAEIYIASTGSWAMTGSMQGGRAGYGMVKLTSGNIFVAGGVAGTAGSVILSTAEEYIVSSGTWQLRPSMHDARARFRLVLLNNGDALAAGGVSGSIGYPSSTAEIYVE
jgi:N-acetylneuraminic acid mutarotase